MEVNVLFARMPVGDFAAALAWYERFFGRAADVVAHDTEVMWQVTAGAWLYIVRDMDHAGSGAVALAVPDILAATSALAERELVVGPILPEGDAGQKAVLRDPDGNSIELIEVAGGS